MNKQERTEATLSAMLKVKAGSLTAEARIIRRAEQRIGKCLHCSRWRREHITDYRDTHGPRVVQYLACEEGGREFKGHRPVAYFRLQGHRTYTVRREARATHLARCFLRGRTYREVEKDARTRPDWITIDRLLKKYATKEQLDGFAEWKAGAQNVIGGAQRRAQSGASHD